MISVTQCALALHIYVQTSLFSQHLMVLGAFEFSQLYIYCIIFINSMQKLFQKKEKAQTSKYVCRAVHSKQIHPDCNKHGDMAWKMNTSWAETSTQKFPSVYLQLRCSKYDPVGDNVTWPRIMLQTHNDSFHYDAQA